MIAIIIPPVIYLSTLPAQLSLQSLEGTVAAISFTEDLNKWHKQLQTIEAVLTTWLKVQLLWVQLEEVCASHASSYFFCDNNYD